MWQVVVPILPFRNQKLDGVARRSRHGARQHAGEAAPEVRPPHTGFYLADLHREHFLDVAVRLHHGSGQRQFRGVNRRGFPRTVIALRPIPPRRLLPRVILLAAELAPLPPAKKHIGAWAGLPSSVRHDAQGFSIGKQDLGLGDRHRGLRSVFRPEFRVQRPAGAQPQRDDVPACEQDRRDIARHIGGARRKSVVCGASTSSPTFWPLT